MAGAVEIQGSSFRAHMQRRGEDGRKEHIRGPHRGEKRKAEQDLERLRAAAEEASDAAWSAMAAESTAFPHGSPVAEMCAFMRRRAHKGQGFRV